LIDSKEEEMGKNMVLLKKEARLILVSVLPIINIRDSTTNTMGSTNLFT
jgi:hypothetical protein